jgi:thiosulfate reductase cytochrome b subunit
MTHANPALEATPPSGGDVVRRHRLSTRVWHWVNALTFFIMLMSGLMIFNAHPRLYWGEYGANYDPAWLQIGVEEGRGYLRIGEVSVDTTGVLGRQTVAGRPQNRAFPGWATIPSSYDLALSRRWHLTFAWSLRWGSSPMPSAAW